MARKSVSPERAWYWTFFSQTKSVGVGGDMALETLMQFDDLEGESLNAIERERSEWFTERIIIWGRLTWFPAGEDTTPQVLACVRLGQMEDEVDFDANLAPSFDADSWSRIYQEDWMVAHRATSIAINNSAVVVDDGAIATAIGFPMPPHYFKWDLSVKTRLAEKSSLVIGVGTGPAIIEFGNLGITGVCKVLLRRGK